MELAKEIRRQFGAAAMARYVRTLPMFEPDFDTPAEMLELLKDLERVEAKARKRGKRR
jgi:hypothetical protein